MRQLANFSRQATKIASNSIQSAASIAKPPTTRKDYVETGQLFISKRLLLMLAAGIVLLALLGYFVIWPFILAHFFTARFFVEDSRVGTWTGRAAVYADAQKTIPMYEGKLSEGVLEGKGKEYDEAGLISFEGTFEAGMRNGKGIEYEDGVIVYEGDFAGNVYEGSGKLYQDGMLLYEGGFSGGIRSGEGTEYFPGDRTRYKGAFADGLFEGQGTEFAEDGSKVYEGLFSQGVYNGAGSLYIEKNQRVDAVFVDGEPDGAIKWYKADKLYYDGEADGITPSGFGTLYTQNGKIAYAGQMANGTLDGAWLITLTAQEFRDTLGECKTADYSDVAGGFMISSPSVGLSALCNYQSAESEPAVRAVYISEPRTNCFKLLPGGDRVALTGWPTPTVSQRRYAKLKGVNTPSGAYGSEVYELPTCRAELLLSEEAPVMLSWSKTGSDGTQAGSGAGNGAADGASEGGKTEEEKLEDFLESLDLMAGTDAASGAAGEQARLDDILADLGLGEEPKQEAEGNPYYGDTEMKDALKGCNTPESAERAINAMLDYWQASEQRAALESNFTRASDLLAEAQNALDSGTGSKETVAKLESEKEKLGTQINNCMVEQTKAGLQAEDAGATAPKDCDVKALAVSYNPADLKVDELALVATAYAQSEGKNEDVEGIPLKIKTMLADLMTSYNNMQGALSSCKAAQADVDNAAGAYATGVGSKTDWYNAQSAVSDSQSAVYSAICDFTKRSNELNTMTGGWLSRTQKWMTDIFSPLYKVEESPDGKAGSTGEGASAGQGSQSGQGSAAGQEPGQGSVAGQGSQPGQGASTVQPGSAVQSNTEGQVQEAEGDGMDANLIDPEA